MTVERRYVLVGIRMDSHSRQLLNWALVKVAEPGDCVIAVHVVRSPGKQVHNLTYLHRYLFFDEKYSFFHLLWCYFNADYVSKSKPLVDGYLEVYEGLCNVKKVRTYTQ